MIVGIIQIQRLLKKFKKDNKISNITQKVTIQRTFISIKFTYFEIQTITWGHMICMTEVLHKNYHAMYLVLEVININCKTTAFITTFENFCCTSS